MGKREYSPKLAKILKNTPPGDSNMGLLFHSVEKANLNYIVYIILYILII